MTELLVKKFVKNHEKVQDVQVRTGYGVLASVVGIVCNLLLFVAKMIVGWMVHSISIMADGCNNLSDAASSIISYVGVKMAEKPADSEHPFGHGRVEYIAAFVVSFLIIEMGFTFFKTSIGKLSNPDTLVFEWIPFSILVLSVLVKIWLSRFNKTLGKRIQSQVMLATAADSMGDVFATSATIVSLVVWAVFQINVDAIAGLIVSVMVMWAGISIAKDTLKPLIGNGPDPQMVSDIEANVEAYEGIIGTHDLIVHNYGPNRSMATIHAEVPCHMTIGDSHELIDRIEREVSKKLGIFLVIHVDPIDMEDERMQKTKEQLAKTIQKIDAQVSFHDFRMVPKEKQTSLIFDIAVPYSYTSDTIKWLKAEIRRYMKLVDSNYVCVITVDRRAVSD